MFSLDLGSTLGVVDLEFGLPSLYLGVCSPQFESEIQSWESAVCTWESRLGVQS